METNTFVPAKINPVLGMLRTFLVIALFHLSYFNGFGNFKSYHFDIIQNRLILKIEMKGENFNFLFDTGANQSIIDYDFANELGMPILRKETLPTLGGKIYGFTTTDTTFNIYPNMRWIIAPLSFDIDSSNFRIHGMIGASELINRHMVDINFETKILSIDPKIDLKNYIEINLEGPSNKNSSGIEKYLPKFPTIMTSINICNHLFQNVKLIIDTGCKYDIAIVANDSSMIKSFEVERRSYKSLNKSTINVVYSDVQLLDTHLKNIQTTSPIFFDGNGKNLFGLLGVKYLKKYNQVIINYPNMKIYFKEARI